MRPLLLATAAAAALFPYSAFAQDVASSATATAKPSPTARSNGAPPAAPAKSRNLPENEIVVTASPFAHKLEDTPTITARVDSKKILESGGASIADSLADVPGVSATGFAAGASRPIIRGMDFNRVRVLEDGTSSSDVADIGPDHGVPIDPLSARSIEVVRGAATLRYGSQAIGGVVNAINDRVPMSLPAQPFSGELTGSYDTVADTWQGSALADVKLGDFALHADAFDRHASDYDTPLGTEPNSYFRGHGESLGGSYFFGDGDSHTGAAIEQYDANYGIPSDTSHIAMRQTKVLSRSAFDLGSGLLKALDLDGSYADYKHDEVKEDGTVATTFRNKELDSRAELLLNRIGFIQNSALGFEFQHRDFSAVGEDAAYLFPTTTQTEAGYLFTEIYPSMPFHLEVSGRVEHVEVQGTPASNVPTTKDFTPLSAAVGALLNVGPSVKLGLTASTTGRAPAMTELFARGAHDGPDTFETGDPDLKIERAKSLEGTVRVHAGPFSFDGSIYSTWFDNYIYGRVTGRMCDEDGNCLAGSGGDFRELDYSQQGAHFRGLEGKASLLLTGDEHRGLSANVMGDYTRATFDDGSNVPRIPPYRIGGGLSWVSDPFDANFMLKWVGRQDKPGAFDTPTPGYVDLGAALAWRPFTHNRNIEFALVGQNLTNAVQRDAAAFNKDEVVMPGRNIRFVVKIATR
jgi:iron complex outermembrane receptor protein